MADNSEISATNRELLVELRDDLNARYLRRRQQGIRLEAEAWLTHVRRRVLPLVDAAHATFPEFSRRVLSELYDVSLDLFAVGHFGEISGLLTESLTRLWEQTLPRFGKHLARHPRRVAGSLSNAVLAIIQSHPSVVDRWLHAMETFGAQADGVEQLLQIGQVAAWTSGMASYRHGALSVAKQLPLRVVRQLLNVPERVRELPLETVLDQLRTNPWADFDESHDEEDSIRHVATCGDFRGFGGPFRFPPQVFLADGQLHATDHEQVWMVIGDRFGHSFQRVDRPAKLPAKSWATGIPQIAADGSVRWLRERKMFPALAGSSSCAFDGVTFAVTLKDSFRIYLLARKAMAL